MKIKYLAIKNFAAYKDVEVNLSTDEGGLVLFQGENSAGKTTVFSAIKWCLYAEATKDKRKLQLEDLFNRDVKKDAPSDPNIKVEVTMIWESNGVDYEMSRKVWYEDPSSKPLHSVRLRPVGGNYVNESDIQRQVEEFLPSRIKEFLLYDGESQETFQKLSGPDGNIALQNSINDLLSVPLIEQASQILTKQRDDWANKKKKADAYAASTAKLEKMLLEIQSDINANEVDRLNWKADVQATEETIDELKEQTATWEEFQAVTNRVDEAEKNCSRIQSLIDDSLARAQDTLSRCFWLPAIGLLDQRRKEAEDASSEFKEYQQRKIALEQAKTTQDKLLESPVCPTCHNQHGMSSDEIKKLLLEISENLAFLEAEKPVDPLQVLQEIQKLNFDPSAADDIDRAISDARRYAADLVTAKQEKLKAELHLAQFDGANVGENLKDIVHQYQKAVQHLPHAKANFTRCSQRRDELLADKSKRTMELAKVGGDASQLAEVATIQILLDAINYGRTVYVGKIRDQVEKHASEAFVSLSAQEDKFAGLKITENFGTVPILKNGAEQEKWINKGHSKLEAIALVQAMLRVALGNDSFLLMDNPETQLDDVRLESIFRWVAHTDLPIGLFVIPDKIDGRWRVKSDLLEIIRPKIARHYVIWRDPKNTEVSHISEFEDYLKIEKDQLEKAK